MSRFNKNFWKYSLALLTVAVVLIVIGSISLGRTAKYSDNRTFNTLNAKENIAALSDENKILKEEVARLKEDVAKKDEEIANLSKKQEAINTYLQIKEGFSQQKYDEVRSLLEGLDMDSLPKEFKEEINKIEEKMPKGVKNQ